MSNLWHIKNWFRVGHMISWPLCFHTLLGFMYLNRHFRYDYFLKHADKKHKFIISYLENQLGDVIEKYSVMDDDGTESDVRYIWTLWWQGEENAPDLVKACIARMRRNAGNAKLVVLSKDNYRDYIELPDYIMNKRKLGIISFAQLSDIFRFTLLEKYGGLWLDSTLYTASAISDETFRYPFYSQHTAWAKTCFVQHNMYHGFCIGSRKGGKLVKFAKEMFFEYWKSHDVLVDYLMIDYIIMLAYMHFPDIRAQIDSLPYTSERLYDLVNMLSEPYDEETFRTLMKECQYSKLDWHRKYAEEVGGRPTFFSVLTGKG